MELRKASRKKTKIRLGFSGPTGSGKTISALLIAYGMTGSWDKVAIVDSENGSGDLYENMTLLNGVKLGEYWIVPLAPPFTPERYIEAINKAISSGAEVVIVDSISHEWMGQGGVLEIADTAKGGIEKWQSITPRHQRFLDAILQAPCHIFTTVRNKQDYAIIPGGGKDGKNAVEKLGMKEITREGFEYELTLSFNLDMNHNAWIGKDRTLLFDGRPHFVPSIETGHKILEWCNSGKGFVSETQDAINKLAMCDSVEDLSILKDGLPEYVVKDKTFKDAALKRYHEVRPKTEVDPPKTETTADNAAVSTEPSSTAEPATQPEPEVAQGQPVEEPAPAEEPTPIAEAEVVATTDPTPQEEKTEFQLKYENRDQIISVLGKANDLRQIQSLFYVNQELIEKDKKLLKMFKDANNTVSKTNPGEPMVIAAPEKEQDTEKPLQTREWFAERIGKQVYCDGSAIQMYSGPYLLESSEYIDYYFGQCQKEGYRFKDL